MALGQSALLDLLAQLKLTDVTDRVRSATETLCQELIDAETAAVIGAGKCERTEDRTTVRNGIRSKDSAGAPADLRIAIVTWIERTYHRRRR